MLCALLLAAGGGAHADTLDTSALHWNAFGTLGAVYQNSRGLAFRRDLGQGRGARAGEVDFGTDSVLGAQLTGHTDFGLSAEVQGVMRRDATGRWRPRLSRAFLRYEPSPAWMLRAGRIGLSIYLLGDALDVGYAYLTVRPPPEVYGILANADFDGADVTYSRALGAALIRLRAFGGQIPFRFATANGGVIDFSNNNMFGLSADYLDGDWETRLAVVRLSQRSAAPFTGLAAGLEATAVPQAVLLAGSLLRTPQNTYAVEAGTNYTGRHLRATAVLVRFDSPNPVGPNENTGYVLLGWQVKDVTPFAVFSVAENFGQARPTGLPPLSVFAPLIAGAAQAQTFFQTTQRDLALGARYDFAPHMDFKVQLDHVWLAHSALIFDANVPPPNRDSMTVASLAVDFAF
ncbi:MAG: hypothetical protein KGL14_09025 [Gammaproteobacteria bacterium]|nr:hypothetical protein [Gammaproteobacteria bacterium]